MSEETKPETITIDAEKLLSEIHSAYDDEVACVMVGAEPDIDQGAALLNIASLALALDGLLQERKRLANALAQANERANHHQAEAGKLRQERDAARAERDQMLKDLEAAYQLYDSDGYDHQADELRDRYGFKHARSYGE